MSRTTPETTDSSEGSQSTTTSNVAGSVEGCAMLADALKDTISIQVDLSVKPEADFEPRFARLEQKIQGIGDTKVKEAGLAYVLALRKQVDAVKRGDTRAATDLLAKEISPALSAVGRLCPKIR